MKIGGYEIPMAGTVIPWALLILLISVVAVFAKRLWNDKELNLKKVAMLTVSMGLIFFTVLNMGDVVVWTSGMVGKIIQIVNNVKV
jgi:hypothetical protein